MEILRLVLNWKTILAFGGAASVVILATKVDPKDAGSTLEAEVNAVSGAFTGADVMKKR